MALIEDFDKFARDFLNNENMVASNPTPIEEDVEIIQVSDEETDVIMDEEPIVIEIDEPLVDIIDSGNRNEIFEIDEPLGGIIDLADENETNQISEISDDDLYNQDLDDDVYLS